MLYIVSTIKYLARQGLPLRGHNDIEENFRQLLQLRAEDLPDLHTFLKLSTTFNSPEIQNEMLNMLSEALLKLLIDKVKNAKFYSAFMDGTRCFRKRTGVYMSPICGQ